MKYRVITAVYDVTTMPPKLVTCRGRKVIEGSAHLMQVEIIDTLTNELFAHCETVQDVEDGVLSFWNRLNPSSVKGPHYTDNPHEKVVVVDCRPE